MPLGPIVTNYSVGQVFVHVGKRAINLLSCSNHNDMYEFFLLPSTLENEIQHRLNSYL